MILSALLTGAMAGVFWALVAASLKTGIVYFQMADRITGRRKITRDDHPVIFWFWTLPLFGAALLLTGFAFLMLTDSAGLTEFFSGANTQRVMTAAE